MMLRLPSSHATAVGIVVRRFSGFIFPMWEILAGLIEDLAKGLLSPRGEGGGVERLEDDRRRGDELKEGRGRDRARLIWR